MDSTDIDFLIIKARAGLLSVAEQNKIGNELEIYRGMALRLERCVHDMIKETEKQIVNTMANNC